MVDSMVLYVDLDVWTCVYIQWQKSGKHWAVGGLKPRRRLIFRKSWPLIKDVHIRNLQYDLGSTNLSWLVVEPPPQSGSQVGPSLRPTSTRERYWAGHVVFNANASVRCDAVVFARVHCCHSFVHGAIANLLTPHPQRSGPMIQCRQLLLGKGAIKEKQKIQCQWTWIGLGGKIQKTLLGVSFHPKYRIFSR